jgi:hypothetical protein
VLVLVHKARREVACSHIGQLMVCTASDKQLFVTISQTLSINQWQIATVNGMRLQIKLATCSALAAGSSTFIATFIKATRDSREASAENTAPPGDCPVLAEIQE